MGDRVAQTSASARALRRLLSAPEHASGYPELRPASANPPVWPHHAGRLRGSIVFILPLRPAISIYMYRPAISGLLSA